LSVWDGATDYGFFGVVSDDASSDGYITDGSTVGERVYLINVGGTDLQFGVSATNIQGTAFGQADTNNLITAIIPANGTSTLGSNGQQIASGTVDPVENNTEIRIGSRYTSSSYWDASMQELVFYASDQSAKRKSIENQINSYYGIY
jgi:hypothetical protein